ncbi:DUF6607 family protein [Roseivirga sp.]|uniref:DUF6607 family protein n=1 Tax=Roseivirga sp. TaxID=1964215 RepID=UPI003B8BB6BC
MKQILVIALCLISISALGQNKKKQDKAAIKEMCGCYKVRFTFAETFAPDRRYEFHKNYKSKGLEWVQLVEEDNNKVSLQHLLIVAPKTIVKHWRQDWLYQNTALYTYDKDNSWKYRELPKKEVKGQWTQKVYQVDGSLRYEGSSSWVHTDGRHYWENTADSPLPRREYSKRTDYNLMVRTNRQELTADGWIHEQDNDKVIRTEKGDKLLAEEKGWNTYTKVDDSECKDAQDWWQNNKRYWSDVRVVWNQVFATKETLTFKNKVDEKRLYEEIFALGDKIAGSEDYNSATIRREVKQIISAYRD